MDFTALIKYEIPDKDRLNAIYSLERTSPQQVRRVTENWRTYKYADISINYPIWVKNFGEQEQIPRPELPTLKASLRMPEGFFITFGYDSMEIYHFLRWQIFLTDKLWQKIMTEACKAFANMFGAVDGIITSDWSPVIEAFFNGKSFDEALVQGQGDDKEVSEIEELYNVLDDTTWDSHGYWRFSV
ncbi:MAG: hypothetical protein GY729_00470 [Desulfobacteraceae bacterium]|nr:hypothetical protein [Desulfobacteraceae bacterium]